MMDNLLIGGLNRGCKEFVYELHDESVGHYDPHWFLADPKGDRAAQMASVLTKRFSKLQPQPLQMPVQDAISYTSDHETWVLALDTPTAIVDTLSRRRAQRVIWQITGRGPGGGAGTRLAIQGTICPNDHDTERRAQLLLHTMAGMSQ